MKKALFVLALLVVAPVKSSDSSSVAPDQVNNPGLLSKGCAAISKGATFVKDGVVYSVVSVKDGMVYAYNTVTGTVEKFTPQRILNLRDSVANLISNHPWLAVALTAFVSVKTYQYLSTCDLLSCDCDDEDDSF